MSPSTPARAILVSGATGNVGRELVRELVERRQPVRALARREGGPIEGAQRLVGDLDKPESILFLLPGYQDMASRGRPAPVRLHGERPRMGVAAEDR